VSTTTDEPDEAPLDEFCKRLIEHVPAKGRLVVWAIELTRLIGEVPTVAQIAEGAGVSEAVARKRVFWLLELGLIAWDEDGLRTALPEVSRPEAS
jgi:hypothetical protein